MSTESDKVVRIDLIYGHIQMKPLETRSAIERRGLFSWWWTSTTKYGSCELWPFMTERACRRHTKHFTTGNIDER